MNHYPIQQPRKRSKSSTNRITMKSPLVKMKNNHTIESKSKQKIGSSKNNTKNMNFFNKSQNNEKVKSLKNIQYIQGGNNKINNNNNYLTTATTTNSFRNKLIVNSYEFNKLKEKLQSISSASSTPNQKTINQINQTNQQNKNIKKPLLQPQQFQQQQNQVKVKIINKTKSQKSQQQQKSSTQSSSTTTPSNNLNTTPTLTQKSTITTLQSQQIQMLKVQNEYFKKIYDQALNELSKLKNKLKEQKKVHDVQKQIYQTQINKLKRIVVVGGEQSKQRQKQKQQYQQQQQFVSQIICCNQQQQQQDGFVIVVSSKIKNQQNQNDPIECCLGLESQCEDNIDNDNQGNISINSNK